MKWAFGAFIAGAAITTQASINAQLGVLLKNSLIGTTIAFAASSFFTLLAVIASTKHYPQLATVQSVPVYLWFSGGALAAFGVGMYYFLIPKMGVGPMMSYALAGQLILAVIASHFGWFSMPVKQIDFIRFMGIFAVIAGVVLINFEK
ncbi:DMT family transporter [Maridesulfovibrio sp.]|uniref:DMT family transporter n=1 Tax=Maridesulfovibrio sp. TaxID=2795000 RepID=UPI0029F49A13|nr:DMT family transporter [Maridesulfovibrio sp.]